MRIWLGDWFIRVGHWLRPDGVDIVHSHEGGVHRVQVLTREGRIVAVANLNEDLG